MKQCKCCDAEMTDEEFYNHLCLPACQVGAVLLDKDGNFRAEDTAAAYRKAGFNR